MIRLACPDCRTQYSKFEGQKYICTAPGCGAVSEWVGPFLVSDGGNVRCVLGPQEYEALKGSELVPQ